MIWLVGLLIFMALVQAAFHLFFWAKISGHPSRPRPADLPMLPVSVIICARNEAANLRKNLPAVLRQDYPAFEVIVVDDGSTDDTQRVLAEFEENHTHLRTMAEKKAPGTGKKAALAKGINAASHELLLLTDADCQPVGRRWLEKMTANLRGGSDLTLGYSPYYKRPGWLNKLMRYEAMQSAFLYFSFALAGIPYMGVGRNIAYRRSLYEQSGGFQSHAHLMSGDDDLFVNAVSPHAQISVCIDKEAFCASEPVHHWLSRWRQKRRHQIVGTLYRRHHLMLLTFFHGSHFLWIVSSLILIFSSWYLVALVVAVFKFLIQMIIFNRLSRTMGERDLILILPLLDLAYILEIIVISISVILKSPDKWK